MEFALIVAKVFAVYLVVSGAVLLFKGKTLPLILKDFFAHPAVVYLTGIILICVGAVLLFRYNVWDNTWRSFATAFGWLALLKGLAYVFFPNVLSEFPVQKMRGWFGAIGVVLIIAGILLFRVG